MLVNNIPLTHDKFAIVDAEDYKWLNQWKWNYHSAGYAVRGKYGGIVNGKSKSITILMHRVIMGCSLGQEIDHINGNRLDNSRSNLRVCSSSQNKQNQIRRSKNKTSKYKGVCWFKPTQQWRAEITVNKVTRGLGYFDNEDNAATAYNEAARKDFGEFAQLNSIKKEIHYAN